MKCLGLVLLVFWCFSSQASKAENSCPWINTATAFGVLGAGQEGQGTSVSSISADTCSFRFQDRAGLHELRIAVKQMAGMKLDVQMHSSRCISRWTPLQAIGNDAMLCDLKEQDHLYGERVVGRVRDSAFTITVIMPVKNNSPSARREIVEKARLIAEQVSGNLF